MAMEFSTAVSCVTSYEHNHTNALNPIGFSKSVCVSSYEHIHTNSINTQVSASENNSYLTEIQIDDGKWTREQTQILINTWKENKHILLNSSSSSSEQFKVWKDILKEVNKLSPPKSLQQCKKKFRNIRYICKTAMNNNKQIGSKKHYPMFYSDFVDIISEYEQSRNNFNELSFKIEMLNDNSQDDWSMEYSHRDDVAYSPENINRNRSPGRENRTFTPSLITSQPSKTPPVEVTTTEGRSPNDDDKEPTVHYACANSQPSERSARKRSQDVEEGEVKADSTKFDKVRPSHQKFVSAHPHNSSIRKQGNSFVSIMGHHYPPPKRVRHLPNSTMMAPMYNDLQPNMRQHHQQRQLEFAKDFYPTMATKSPIHDVPLRADDITFAPRHIYEKHNDKSMVGLPNTNINLEKHLKGHNHDMPHVVSPVCPSENNDKNNNSATSDDIHDRFLTIQERQMEIFNDMLNRHEQFLMQLLAQQKEAAEAAQERDRQFMFKLIEIFVKQK